MVDLARRGPVGPLRACLSVGAVAACGRLGRSRLTMRSGAAEVLRSSALGHGRASGAIHRTGNCEPLVGPASAGVLPPASTGVVALAVALATAGVMALATAGVMALAT